MPAIFQPSAGPRLSGPSVRLWGDTKAYIRLRKLIAAREDVLFLHVLRPVDPAFPAGQWFYLIETPFDDIRRFVVGKTDPNLAEPTILFRSREHGAARNFWREENLPSPA